MHAMVTQIGTREHHPMDEWLRKWLLENRITLEGIRGYSVNRDLSGLTSITLEMHQETVETRQPRKVRPYAVGERGPEIVISRDGENLK